MAKPVMRVFARQIKPDRKWIVVAATAGAKIFESMGRGARPRLIRELKSPEGRLQDKEIDTDKEGQVFGGGASNPRKHALSGEQKADEHLTGVFAHKLAGMLEVAKNQNLYDSLILVAEPHFLGLLKAAIGLNAGRALAGCIDKDLSKMPQHNVEEFLKDRLAA